MNSAQFQGSAKSTPFAPLQAPDLTDDMRQQSNDQLRWMREDRQMIIDDRRQYAAALDRQMRDNQSIREKDLDNLAGLSKTLTDTLLQVKKDTNQRQQEEGLMLYYETGLPLEQAEQFDKDEQTLAEARDKTNEFADRQARSGAPPEILDKIRGLSGWKKYGYLIGLAQDAGLKWGEYLDNALMKDNETQVDLGGRVITPSQVTDKAEMVAVATVLRKKFMRENGLTGANPALLNKYLFPNMKQGEAGVISARHTAMVSAQAQETLDEQDGILTTGLMSQGDPGTAFNAYVSNLRSVFDPKTRSPLGPGGARDRALGVIEALARDGQIDPSILEKVQNTLIPGSSTETWGGKFPQKFLGLQDAIRAGKEADLAADDREEARADEEQVKQLIALGEQKGGYTQAEIEQIRSQYNLAGKPIPGDLERLLTVEQKSDRAARDYLNRALADGRGITEQELRSGGYSPEIILEYQGRVRSFEQNVANNDSFKAGEKALHQRLLNLTLDSTPQGSRPHWTLELAKSKASELLRTETLRGVQSGMSPSAAAQAAVLAVEKLIVEGQPTTSGAGKGPFAVAVDKSNPQAAVPNGGFVGLLGGVRGLSQQKEAEFNRIYHQVQANRAGGRFLDMPLIGPSDLAQLEQLRENPSLAMPASVLYLSQVSRTNSPWDVADRQLKAAGRQPLTRPPQVQWSDSIDPRLKALLIFSPSHNRTQRAYSGTAWNPAKVPKGYGVFVERAAKKYGLDPAILAGLIQVESSWNPSAASGRGPVGLTQINTDTLADGGITAADRLNPEKSIMAGARILSQRLQATNGDLTLALRSYNMGLGGALRNPGGYPGDSESKEYPGKVLRAAAAYGYGFGEGSPFRRQDTMNPRLAYRIGNLGYGSTGPHLDVKPVQPGSLDGQSGRGLPAYKAGTLDPYVLVKRNGKLVPLSKGSTTTDNDAKHRARKSFGHDYAAPDGTEVYLRNGARVAGTYKGDGGTDHTIIELPDGRRFQFLHGRNA
jgi:soluble lytic murein transglycosylase-like protein